MIALLLATDPGYRHHPTEQTRSNTTSQAHQSMCPARVICRSARRQPDFLPRDPQHAQKDNRSDMDEIKCGEYSPVMVVRQESSNFSHRQTGLL